MKDNTNGTGRAHVLERAGGAGGGNVTCRMLTTLLCIQHLWLVGCLSRRSWVSAPIEYFAPTEGGEATHIHFYMSREKARILFGQLPLHVRNKIRSLESVSFQDEVEEEEWRIEDARQYAIDCAEAERDAPPEIYTHMRLAIKLNELA